jgi:hypothetical protein
VKSYEELSFCCFFDSWWMGFFSSDISVCAMAKAWIYAMEIGI